MQHHGQCPDCHHVHELSEEDLGQLFTCDCGATSFCCHVIPSARIDLVCGECGESYEVSGKDAGQRVECECGHQFNVPTAMLRPSIAAADSNDSAAPPTLKNQEPVADSPAPAADGFALAINTDDPPAKKNEPAKPRSPRNRKTDPLSWVGIGAVAVLLIVATVMFVRRDMSPVPSKSSTASASESDRSINQPSTSQQAISPQAVASSAASVELPTDPVRDATLVSIDSTIPPVTPVAGESDADTNEAVSEDDWSDDFPIPPAPLYALPEPQKARPRIPLSNDRQPYMTLRLGVQEAFDAYEETQELMLTAEETSSDTDRQAYQQSMGRTLALVQHVHDLAAEEKDLEQLTNMRYLLAFLYYNAGHLPEACIMGQAVARWGKVDEPATREGAMIALAAAQEASDTQWGSSEQVGELGLLESTANLLAQRWPDDDQLDSVWMNLGYLHEAFNRPEKAVEIYRRVPAKSIYYADAMFAIGTAQWTMVRRQAIKDQTSMDQGGLKEAERSLKRALQELEKKDSKLRPRSIQVRLALAQIALTRRQHDQAEKWLKFDDKPLINQIQLSDGKPQKDRISVDDYTVRQIFDAQYYLHLQRGAIQAANQVLERMASAVDSVEIDLDAQWLSTVKRAADRIASKPVVTRGDVDEFAELASNIMDEEERFPTDNLLWLAETWGRFSEKAKDQKTTTLCASRAAEIYDLAISRTDFPSASMQSAQLRRIEWLRRADDFKEALRLIEDLLAKTPNVFAMQIAAAECLQEIGVASGKVGDLQAAIDGPQGFSSIWGWAKLVRALYSMRWSANGTETHAQQLLLAQFRLAQCQLLVAERTTDSVTKRTKLADTQRLLQTILSTMDPENPWYAKFKELNDGAIR